MSCPRLDDHLRSPQDPATAAALARHAEGCPECAQRRAALTRAQDILRSDVPPPMDPAAPARWLAAAETARAPRWGWLAATSLAAVAAIALGLVLRAPAPAVTVEGPHASLPPELGLDDGWLRLEPGAEARVSGLTLSVSAPLALQGLPERPLRVGYGAAEILVARAEAAPPLETPAGRIALGAGRFTVKVTGQQTLLTVKEGRARLTDARGATRTVEAGEQASLPFASASTAQPSLLNTGPTDHTSPDPARAPEAQRAPAWGEAPNAVVQDGHGPSAPNAVAQPGATSRGADAPSPHGPPGPAPRARAVDQPARDDDAPSPHSPPGAAPGAHAVADATSADSQPGPAPRARAVDQPARADDAPRPGNQPSAAPPYAARTAGAAARDRDDVATARRLIGRDDARAADLAEAVLARRPAADTEAEALMVAADAQRRQGHAAAAERFYRLAAKHPGGAGFREEALLQRAAQLEALGRAEEAMTALRRAASAFPDGGLAPERAALMATLGLKLGRLDEARDALLAVADRSDRVLDGPRVAVAEALLASEPRRAQALLQHVVSRPGPAQAAARALSARAEELF